VDALYHLFNTGETTTVTVGVPKYGHRDDYLGPLNPGRPIVFDFLRFDVRVNGKSAEFVEEENSFAIAALHLNEGCCERNRPAEIRWMTKRITFTGKMMTTIRVRYEAHYNAFHAGSGRQAQAGYYYDSVGRYWKGKVGTATFIIDTTDAVMGTRDEFVAWYTGLQRVAVLTGYISQDEVRQWEPSSCRPRLIPGLWSMAKWKGIGRTHLRPLGPGGTRPPAPTRCNIEPLKYP
jgi:hypothetical protein